ncbi:hypothetical protein [Dolichospermum sp. LEGE 00246]|uniref:hypothetical protein n=1 Tax=Dolichospermum sp. LEGE 00246 TaxID=1828605 RepID=UPI001D153210|nr:hypothetical protein [Dolichospermum sp. LEGE 00246]
MFAEDELSSLLECVYLLRSPENARPLFRAFKWTEMETPQTLAELKEKYCFLLADMTKTLAL